MNKFMPYLKLAGSILAILAVYKILIQPRIPASLVNYAPSV